jgi:hypothetical protein
VRKSSVNVHRKSLSIAVKLDVTPAEGTQSFRLTRIDVQSVLKSNDKMQEYREIERPSKALKLNSTLSTFND